MSAPPRVLELRSVFGTGGGPEKTILHGAALTRPEQVAVTVCYIRDARDPVFAIGARARTAGVDYVEIVERHSFDPTIWPRLRRLMKERHIDIVHAHDYKTDLLALLLSWREGTIALSTVHGWTGHTRREQVYYAADKRLLRRFPRLIAVSEEIRHVLISHGARPDRVTTVLNGIDHRIFRRDPLRRAAERSRLGFADDDIVVGAVGRLEPQKRFDLLIDSVVQLQKRWPNILLAIAGDGSLRASLQAHADSRLGNRCRLLGHCDDVIALHHAFDVFAQSSTYEGTPNAVLEAMALETPLVATSAGGTAEIVRQDIDGLVVPPENEPALTDALAALLADPAAARRRATNARHRVETDLSFDARMKKVERIYEELVATARK